jgi:BirA family biotin operon repressor/biotin-[acetyl-CoA-carboxylase] ligase
LNVQWSASLDSTMDAVSAVADAGGPAGYVLVADEQTAGRGRRGHEWSSPPGAGLYCSYLHRPQGQVELVTLAAGVGVRQGVLGATGVDAHLKWPNDLLIGRRKVGGLLAEGSRVGTRDATVIIGIGINLRPAAHPPEVETRATCLEAATGAPVSRGDVLAAVLEGVCDALAHLEAGRGSDILQSWRAASPTAVGTPVEWSEAAVARRGVTAGVDQSGALLVKTPSGLERVVGGELRWTLP